MASVTLSRVWVYLVSDPSNPITAGSVGSMGNSAESSAAAGLYASQRTDTRDTGATVRKYANGVFRAVLLVGFANSYGFTLRMLTMAQVELMQSWCGQTVLIRDRSGRHWYGMFPAISVADYPHSPLHDVSATFQQTSYSDAV